MSLTRSDTKTKHPTASTMEIDINTITGYTLEKLFFGAQKEFVESIVIPRMERSLRVKSIT